MKPATIKIWATGNHDWTTGSWNAEECNGRFSPQQFEYTLSSHAAAPLWQPIETAPHGVDVLLYCPDMGCQTNRERIELGAYSTGRRIGGTSSMSYHSWATHWMPLPKPPEATP